MGSHISAVRVALRKVVAGHIPYIYTPVYEGGERTPGVMAIGETPRAQWRPAIEWLAEHQAGVELVSDRQRLCLAVALPQRDQEIHRRRRRACRRRRVRADRRARSQQPASTRIRAARPDVVLITLIGADSVVFNRAFAEQGLGSQMLRLAGAMDETVLLGIGADNTENLFCASGYFIDIGLARQRCFPQPVSKRRSAATRRRSARSRSRTTKGCGFWRRSRRAQDRWRGSRCSRLPRNVDYQGARGTIGIRAAAHGCRSISRRPTGSTSA